MTPEKGPQDFLEFQVVFELFGPKWDMDEHQNWMRDIHTLANLDVTTEELVPNGIRLICWVNADSMLDAMIMGLGMFTPLKKASAVKVTSMQVKQKQ